MREKVELWKKLREDNKELQAQIDANKALITDIEQEILKTMSDTEVDKISLGGYTFTRGEKLLPKIIDFEALVQFMADTGNTALLQRRVGQRAFQEYFESYGFYPDGLDAHIEHTISARKG